MEKIKTRLDVVEKFIGELQPYDKNPRRNDNAVDPVAESIRRYGFKQPIVVDRDGVIVCGHTRYKAAQKLGLKKVPVVVADDLTPEQIRAFRIADNKVAELATWDEMLLAEELLEVPNEPMELLGFDEEELPEESADWFDSRKRFDNDGLEDESEEYQEFVDKFEQKRTTDDCYTPDIIYNAVVNWVAAEYGLSPARFCRPFFPGGDYQAFDYSGDRVVVDNPPFSILSEIVRFYTEAQVPFFIFAPSLTLFSAAVQATGVCTIAASASITYENGAVVKTSFITNLEPGGVKVRTAPELTRNVLDANKQNLAAQHKSLPKYEYPDFILTAAMVGRWSEIGVDYALHESDCLRITEMDEQRECGKAIFGGGYLLSEKAAAEKWALSDREWAIVKTLGKEAAEDGK